MPLVSQSLPPLAPVDKIPSPPVHFGVIDLAVVAVDLSVVAVVAVD
jgi:hypothetical protein